MGRTLPLAPRTADQYLEKMRCARRSDRRIHFAGPGARRPPRKRDARVRFASRHTEFFQSIELIPRPGGRGESNPRVWVTLSEGLFLFRTLALPYTEPWLGIGALTVQNARRSDCGTRSAGGGGCRPPRKRDARVRFALRKMLVCACRVWRKTRGATPLFFCNFFLSKVVSLVSLVALTLAEVKVCELLTF